MRESVYVCLLVTLWQAHLWVLRSNWGYDGYHWNVLPGAVPSVYLANWFIKQNSHSFTVSLQPFKSWNASIITCFQDGLTGSAWGDWSLYTDSPLRAFEEELGVQAPVGFWDPVGYTRDGDLETFKRRRETEIKHGRVAMYVLRMDFRVVMFD